jgi:hypothetical protein
MLKLQTSLLVVFVLVPMPACADWPLFRGNERQDGVARTTLPDVLEVKWKIKLEDGIESTAAIVKDTAYVGCFDQHLYALDLKNGAVQWKYKAGPIKAPVAYREGMLFVGDEDGLFHCVDAAKGTKIWTFQTGNEISAGANFSGDKILVGSHDSHLYCLDQKGKETWKFKIEGGPVMATPVVAGKLTFVAGCDSMMHFIDLEKGTGLAKIELGGQVGASAAVLGNHAYVGTMTNDFKALDLTKKEVIWNVESKKEQPFHASAAVKDDVVVTGGARSFGVRLRSCQRHCFVDVCHAQSRGQFPGDRGQTRGGWFRRRQLVCSGPGQGNTGPKIGTGPQRACFPGRGAGMRDHRHHRRLVVLSGEGAMTFPSLLTPPPIAIFIP